MIWRKRLIEERTRGGMTVFEKWVIILYTPTPNQHPPKMDVLPKYFIQIILAVWQLVRHSNTSFKQQRRRPFSSLLSDPSVCMFSDLTSLISTLSTCTPQGSVATSCKLCRLYAVGGQHRWRINIQKKRQKSLLLFEWHNLLSYLPPKNRMNSSFSSNHSGAIHHIL